MSRKITAYADTPKKGQRRPALALRHALKGVDSLLRRRLQREQAHGGVERRRCAEEPGGGGDACSGDGEARLGLVVGLVRQECLEVSVGLRGERLAERGAHGGALQ